MKYMWVLTDSPKVHLFEDCEALYEKVERLITEVIMGERNVEHIDFHKDGEDSITVTANWKPTEVAGKGTSVFVLSKVPVY